jgi:hypothetical protein
VGHDLATLGWLTMIRYFPDLEQGSDAWLAARCGLLTASEMKLILTPALKIANNDKARSHLYEPGLCTVAADLAQSIERYEFSRIRRFLAFVATNDLTH